MTEPAPDQPGPTEPPVEPVEPIPEPVEAPSRRRLFSRRARPETATDAPATGLADAAQGPDADPTDAPEADDGSERIRPGVLRRRRRALTAQYEQGLFDIGGLALELHRRGLLAEGVMRRRAAEVRDIREQLERVDDRLLEIRSDRAERRATGRGPGLHCPACNARCRPSANFCASCGFPLRTDGAAPDSTAADQPTIVIAEGSDQATQVIVAAPDTDQPTAGIPAPHTEGTT